MIMRGLRHVGEYLAVRVALSLIQAVSIETCQAVCRVLAWLAADVFRLRGRVVEENLRDEQRHLAYIEQALRDRIWETSGVTPTI